MFFERLAHGQNGKLFNPSERHGNCIHSPTHFAGPNWLDLHGHSGDCMPEPLQPAAHLSCSAEEQRVYLRGNLCPRVENHAENVNPYRHWRKRMLSPPSEQSNNGLDVCRRRAFCLPRTALQQHTRQHRTGAPPLHTSHEIGSESRAKPTSLAPILTAEYMTLKKKSPPYLFFCEQNRHS